jgi:hypothetical protein
MDGNKDMLIYTFMSFSRFKLIAVSFFIVCSAIPSLLNAQNPASYTLRGLITDFQTGEPLEFANVQIVRLATNQEAISTSNSNGVYEFRSVLRGSYRLSVRFIGYENFNDTLVVDGELASVTLNIRLKPTSQNLSEVVISGNQQLDVQRPLHIGKTSLISSLGLFGPMLPKHQ